MAEAADKITNDMTHETQLQGTGVGTEGKADAVDLTSKTDHDKGVADKRKAAEDAEKDAVAKRVALENLRAKNVESKMSDEEIALAKAEREADVAASKAAQLRAEAEGPGPAVASEVAGHPIAASAPDMRLGDHRAQRFGNIPANPKPANGEQADPEKMTQRMLLRSPNSTVPQETWVHPDMVGDYARAGWEVG